MKNILKKLKSDDPVTREQILEFLISDNQIIPFKNIKHPNDQIKLGIYIGLVHLGFEEYIKNILALLHSEDYQVRCAAANSLGNTIAKNPEIMEKLNERLKIEPTCAVKSSLSAALSRLSAM